VEVPFIACKEAFHGRVGMSSCCHTAAAVVIIVAVSAVGDGEIDFDLMGPSSAARQLK